jgi:hypothetical protein
MEGANRAGADAVSSGHLRGRLPLPLDRPPQTSIWWFSPVDPQREERPPQFGRAECDAAGHRRTASVLPFGDSFTSALPG